MYDIMMIYDGDQKRYAQIAGHGFKILAEAMEANLPYKIKCPAQLICGEKTMQVLVFGIIKHGIKILEFQ